MGSPISDQLDSEYPTLDRLGVKLPDNVDAAAVMHQWFTPFAQSLESGDAQGLADLILPDGFWRDMLSLTWDFRTFYTRARILSFLQDRLARTKVSKVILDEKTVTLLRPYPDVAAVQAYYSFETEVGICSGVARVVPTKEGPWKAHVVYTNLEDLKGHPELIGPNRDPNPNHGKWLDQRQREIECEGEDEQPTVVIIGAGQSGLEVAARLKYLGIKSLVIEKEARIGHLWRSRYEALCLHDTVWYDQMPYMRFPPTWPIFAPAPKIAAWLEHYAFNLELNVWTSARLLNNKQDPETKKWTLEIERSDGSKRTLIVNHIVGAVGIGGGKHIMPKIPGTDEFQGKILHSGTFTTARDYIGKKVAVVGACTSGHDICRDFYEHGVDVTMIQRSSTYIMSVKDGCRMIFNSIWNEFSDTDAGDRLNASLPLYANKEMTQRLVKEIADADKETLDGLHEVGFRTNMGLDGMGFGRLAWSKAGGYYFDVGTSKLIAERKIKLKNDGQISRFTASGLEFDNGTTLDADVVLFATGYGDARDTYRDIFGDEVADKLKPIWGLNSEGEINSIYRDSGVPHLWTMMGNLALCRFHSKHIALQIKAIEEGLWDEERYSLKE